MYYVNTFSLSVCWRSINREVIFYKHTALNNIIATEGERTWVEVWKMT